MNEAFFLGYPVEFHHLCLVYPPKIKDIINTTNYGIYLKMLTFSQEEVEDEFVKNEMDLTNLLTPLEYLFNNAYNNKDFEALAHKAFNFFIHEDVTFLYEQKIIVIGELKDAKTIEDLRILKEADFFDFQNLVRQANGLSIIEPPNKDEDPRVKAIKAKARYRDQVKSKKGTGLKLKTTLASLCCMGYNLNPLNIGELSYAAIPTLISTYQEKEKYEIDIQSLLAGADSKKIKPKYWIRNLED